jgi:chaperonin cofactor prefoldin
MAFKMKYKNLKEVVEELRGAVKAHGKQADTIEKHIKEMKSPLAKKYVSDAQRMAVHATKADGGAGNPNKK